MVCICYSNSPEIVAGKKSLANPYKRDHQSDLMISSGGKGVMDSIKEVIFITLIKLE